MLDFLTLYIIILLNTVCLAIIWAGIAWAYRSFPAARYWLTSLLVQGLGGVCLALDGTGPAGMPTFAGIWLLATGYCVMWQGVRVFYGKAPNWPLVAIILAVSAVAILGIDDERMRQNIVYAVVQFVPIALAALSLQRAPLRLGALVVFGGAALAFAGGLAEASANLARLMGLMSTERYYDFAAWFLVASIIGGSTIYLGFLLMAIDRLRGDLVALAVTDDLTGLSNRRGFLERAELYARTAPQGAAAGVVMIDLDNFKSINDRYGHAAGDACLIHLARIAGVLLRPDDIPARLSGDEFCLLLPDTDIREAEKIADRLSKALSARPFEWRGHPIAISASLGVAEWRHEAGSSIHDVLENADAALYRAKRAGKDRYIIHDASERTFAQRRAQA